MEGKALSGSLSFSLQVRFLAHGFRSKLRLGRYSRHVKSGPFVKICSNYMASSSLQAAQLGPSTYVALTPGWRTVTVVSNV